MKGFRNYCRKKGLFSKKLVKTFKTDNVAFVLKHLQKLSFDYFCIFVFKATKLE